MVDAGGARLVADAELARPDAPERLAPLLADLMGDRARILSAATASRTLAKPDAAATIARHCMEVSA
jgi:UDP-N-acetylglucosamine--N-acetylmuramyl-(pentapeptide) pyrophosphoryl-undecaprenol N-acetylglucosamine transferase